MAVVCASRAAKSCELVQDYDKIIIIVGNPFNIPGSRNILRVAPDREKLILKAEVK